MVLPPYFAWLPGCAASMGRALGCTVTFELKATVNPLVYTIRFTCDEEQTTDVHARLWNLLQIWATQNSAHATAVTVRPGRILHAEVATKFRAPFPVQKNPWG